MNILLVCAGGMSTSLMVEEMKKYAEPSWNIKAVGVGELENEIDKFDVVLLGPQLKFKMKKIKVVTDAHGKALGVMDTVAYGRMDGKKIINQAKELIE